MSMYRQYNPKFVLADLQSNLSRISSEHSREVLTRGYSTDTIQTRILQFVRLTLMLRGINKLFKARESNKAYRQAIKLQVRELHGEVAWLKKEMNKLDYQPEHTLTTVMDATFYHNIREKYMERKVELKVKQDILTNLNIILDSREEKKKPVKEPAVIKNMAEFVEFYKNVVKNH